MNMIIFFTNIRRRHKEKKEFREKVYFCILTDKLYIKILCVLPVVEDSVDH